MYELAIIGAGSAGMIATIYGVGANKIALLLVELAPVGQDYKY